MGSVPIATVAKVFGKDMCWVRAGIISGWLPIGIATRNHKVIHEVNEIDSSLGRICYYVSPRKLWELTGFVWKGKGTEVKITEEQYVNFMDGIEQMINDYLDGRN